MIRKRDDVPAEADPSVEDAIEALVEPEHDGPSNRLTDVEEGESVEELLADGADGADGAEGAEETDEMSDEVSAEATDTEATDDEADDASAPRAEQDADEVDAAGDAAEADDADADDGEQAAADGDDAPQAEADGDPASDAAPTDAELADDLGPADEGEQDDEPGGSGRPLTQRVEAILFAAAAPLAPAKLARVLDEPVDAIKEALEQLVEIWAERPGAIDLVAIAGGWRFMTRPEFQVDLAGMAKKGKIEKLSPAALETLAIVAYKQPLTRVEVEAIRGVAAGPLLRVLLDRDLIRVSGRSPEPGHPLLYGTTKRFLDHFGLDNLRSLPDITDLLDVS